MSNVQGYVEFTEESEDTTVAVFHLQTNGQFQWEIKQFPVLTTDGHTCDDAILGNRYWKDFSFRFYMCTSQDFYTEKMATYSHIFMIVFMNVMALHCQHQTGTERHNSHKHSPRSLSR